VNHVNKLMSNGLPFLHMYIRSLSEHSTSLKILRSHAQNHQKLQPGRKQNLTRFQSNHFQIRCLITSLILTFEFPKFDKTQTILQLNIIYTLEVVKSMHKFIEQMTAKKYI